MTKLISLEAENFMKLKAVRLEIKERGLTVISGRNAQGKSAVLNIIQSSFGGKKGDPDRPLRDGAEKGYVVTETDDFIVRRTYTKKGEPRLVVTNKDNSPLNDTPQAMLEKFFGKLSFDPGKFSRMKEPEQIEEIKRVSGLDISDLETKKDDAFQRRKDAKVLLKDRDSKVKSFGGHPPKAERVDTEAISVQLRDIRAREDTAARLESRKLNLLEEHNSIKGRIASLNEQLEKVVAEGKDINRELAEIGEVVDSPSKEELATQLDSMTEINAAAQVYDDYQAAVATSEEQAAIVKGFDDALRKAREEIADRIASVEIPVTGMTITSDGLFLNDQPFSQASQAEMIRAGVELCIGADPEAEFLLVRDGSLLDNESKLELAKVSEERDVQILFEQVSTDDEAGIIIEDGEVVQS